MITQTLTIKRGEIWAVRFDPSEGDEIKKTRPAVVLTSPAAGRMRLQIVVPITGWQPKFGAFFWMTPLLPSPLNGLSKDSAADSFQVKSLAVTRFQTSLGQVTEAELEQIVKATALCIGVPPSASTSRY